MVALGYSRFLWGRFCPNQKLATVLRCHIDAFAALGGIPEEILYDRMKTVVLGNDESARPIYNPSLVALANHPIRSPRGLPATGLPAVPGQDQGPLRVC